jgi:hypothetical protein
MFQRLSLKDTPKFTQIDIFGLKIHRLATQQWLRPKHTNVSWSNSNTYVTDKQTVSLLQTTWPKSSAPEQETLFLGMKLIDEYDPGGGELQTPRVETCLW